MIELGVRRVDNAVTQSTDLQTEINVVEGNRKPLFIKAFGLPKDFGSGHQTGAGDRADVADDIWKIEIVPEAAIQAFEGVTAVIVQAHHYTGVLNKAIW